MAWTLVPGIWDAAEEGTETKGLGLISRGKVLDGVLLITLTCSRLLFSDVFCYWTHGGVWCQYPQSSGLWPVFFKLATDSVWRGLFEFAYWEQPCLSTGGEKNCLFEQLREMYTEADLPVSLSPQALDRIQNNSCLLHWADQRISI